jgi:hypothetical protein
LRGCRHFILGSGVTNAAEDNLLRFKRKFGPPTVPFTIGTIVHEERAHADLCQQVVRLRRAAILSQIKHGFSTKRSLRGCWHPNNKMRIRSGVRVHPKRIDFALGEAQCSQDNEVARRESVSQPRVT